MSEQTERISEFEKALAELEKLVEQLESGDLTLEESLDQFERGIKLARECQSVLKNAELKVAKLLETDQAAQEEVFEEEDKQ
jgi:exodeoxyribonuclease VII small subunit